MPTAHPESPRVGHRRGGRAFARRSAALTLLALLVACGLPGPLGEADPAATTGRLTIGHATIDLAVTGCATIGGRFTPALPSDGGETTLTATGRSDTGEPVEVVVRRTRSSQAPHVVHSVEIGIGEPRQHVEALVLYRAFDEDTGRWTGIDPDAPSSRIDADGPLLTLLDGRLQATGIARRAPTGAAITISLQADCPIDTTDGPGLA